MDTTDPFPEVFIGNRYWIGVVDNYSCYSWSFFTKTKSQLKNMESFFSDMMPCGTPVKYPRYDNAGEQKSKFHGACKKKGCVGIHYAVHTPAERSHREKIFRYYGRIVSNAVKRETQSYIPENYVGRGYSYMQTRKKQYVYHR